MIDKRGVLRQEPLENLVIEVGCGPLKRYPDSVGVDILDTKAVDVVGDALEVLKALPAGCARLVTSSHFLEHVPDTPGMLEAMARVLQPGGRIEVIVPHFAHPYFHSDPTHQNAPLGFGLYTMSYYVHDPIFRRWVPGYVRNRTLQLVSVDLRFKSSHPFYGRYAIKWTIGLLFNSCRYMQELWEENFCFLFPCFEIRYVLTRRAGADPARRRPNAAD